MKKQVNKLALWTIWIGGGIFLGLAFFSTVFVMLYVAPWLLLASIVLLILGYIAHFITDEDPDEDDLTEF